MLVGCLVDVVGVGDDSHSNSPGTGYGIVLCRVRSFVRGLMWKLICEKTHNIVFYI